MRSRGSWAWTLGLAAGFCLAAGAQNPLKAPMERYEEGAVRLALGAPPEEKAGGIAALAAVASPRFPEIRDALAYDTSREVRMALLQAFRTFGDRSPQARAILVDSLISQDERVAFEAVRLERDFSKAPMAFGEVWSSVCGFPLWSSNLGSNVVDMESLTGIAALAPWNDPAWAKIVPERKIQLLSRAGTRESIVMAFDLALTKDGFLGSNLEPAEPVDVPYLRELLSSGHPRIVSFASESLIKAGDAQYLDRLRKGLKAWADAKRLGKDGPYQFANHRLDLVLKDLDSATLRTLAEEEPQPYVCNAVRPVLAARGEPITGPDKTELANYARLNDGIDRSASAARWTRWRAMTVTKAYADLPAAIEEILTGADPGMGLGQFNSEICSLDFLVGVPPAVAEECAVRIQLWMEANPKISVRNSNYDLWSKLCETRGMVAPERERDRYFTEWRRSPAPLQEEELLRCLFSCVDRRVWGLSKIMAPHRSGSWFPRSIFPTLFPQEKMASSVDPCEHAEGEVLSFPFLLPAGPPAVAALANGLRSDLRGAGFGRDPKPLLLAFLSLREALGSGDVESLNRAQKDGRPMVAQAARAALGFSQPADLRRPPNEYDNFTAYPLNIPGPDLTPEDVAWMEDLLAKSRKDYFDQMVACLRNPGTCRSPRFCSESTVGGAGDGFARRSWVLSLPDATLVGAGPEFAPEIRNLLADEIPAVRLAAAWALWTMFREPGALAIFEKEARDPNSPARRQALSALIESRVRDAAALFPPLLGHKDPQDRQLGLRGIEAFGMAKWIPDVENHIADPDLAVSGMAAQVLGIFHAPQDRSILLALVKEGSPLREAASEALTHYRSDTDLDVMVNALAEPKADPVRRLALVRILHRITLHLGPGMYVLPAGGQRKAEATPEVVEDWKRWWKVHRKEPWALRLKSSVVEMVEVSMGDESEEAKVARWQLKQVFTGLQCFNPWESLSATCRDILTKWWEGLKDKDAWDILTSAESAPLSSMDLLGTLDPVRAKGFLFHAFMAPFVGDLLYFKRGGGENACRLLVQCTGVDFGNPSEARCGAREEEIQAWKDWGRKEGWGP